MLMTFLQRLGLQQLELHLNSLGDAVCRPRYREELKSYIRGHLEQLCPECQGRFERNPLRVLDCKKEGCRAVMRDAPQTMAFLCEPCRQHFDTLADLLAGVGIGYVLDPKLVRGLDYYTRTTFEVVAEGLGAQNSVTGGGRYDGLIEESHLGPFLQQAADDMASAKPRRSGVPHVAETRLGLLAARMETATHRSIEPRRRFACLTRTTRR